MVGEGVEGRGRVGREGREGEKGRSGGGGGSEGTFFTGGVEVEAFEEVVHLDALALGRAGLWVLGRALVGFKVMRTGGWAVAVELSGCRGLLLAGVQRALLP